MAVALLQIVAELRQRKTALNAAELADILQISKNVVYRDARRGTIPSFKVGDLRRFDPGALASWLESLTEARVK